MPLAGRTDVAIERRTAVRFSVSLECSWSPEARILDMSVGGCFVDTRFAPSPSRRVNLSIVFSHVPLPVHGIVAHAQPGVGFGMEFGELPDDTVVRLHECLINAMRRSSKTR